jgi:hypothetical protein
MENFNSIAEIDVADFVIDIDYANAPCVSILDLDIDYANAPLVSILDLDINKLQLEPLFKTV